MRKRKLTRCLLAAFLAVAALNTARAADVTNVIINTTFEYDPVGTLEFSYPYKYEWGGTAPEGYTHTFMSWNDPVNDPTATNSMGQFTFDNTVYGDFITNNAANSPGYGFGFGGGLRYDLPDGAPFTRTNLEDYIISWDMRVEGLKPGQATANGEFQIRFDTVDDVIQPPDADANRDTLMQVNFGIPVGSNWTHYVRTLDQGGISGGKTEKDFQLYRLLIDEPRFGVNFHMPHDGFDYDWDNAVYIDNIKVEVIERAPTNPPPTVPFKVCEYNWDDKPVWYAWGDGGRGWSAGTQAYYYVTNNAAGEGVGGSNGFVFRMDNTELAATPPAWAGGNCGFGGPGDYAQMTSPDLSTYNLVLDARVVGLNPASYSANATVQLRFVTPDDTIQPPDANTGNDDLIRLDFNVAGIATNWQTFKLSLGKASVGEGSKQNVSNYLAAITESNFQVQFQNSQSEGNWGFDGDNTFIIDNVYLERLQVGCPPLTIANGTVSWDPPSSGTVKLQQTSDIAGAWSDVTPAPTSPYTIPAGPGPKYYRTIWVPPAL